MKDKLARLWPFKKKVENPIPRETLLLNPPEWEMPLLKITKPGRYLVEGYLNVGQYDLKLRLHLHFSRREEIHVLERNIYGCHIKHLGWRNHSEELHGIYLGPLPKGKKK